MLIFFIKNKYMLLIHKKNTGHIFNHDKYKKKHIQQIFITNKKKKKHELNSFIHKKIYGTYLSLINF